jgi:hypothetical protein
LAEGADEEWDGHRVVHDLVRQTDELRDLYRRLGYSPYVADECRKLLAQLDSLEVVILDFPAFQSSLDESVRAVECYERGERQEALADGTLLPDNLQRFKEVVNARASQDEVLKLLNADWRQRLPIHVEVRARIERRARDRDAFARALAELDALFRKKWIPQSADEREQLLEKVAELRRELDYDPSSLSPIDLSWQLKSLESSIEFAVLNIADQEQDEKKRKLDAVLFSFVYVRHNYQPPDPYFVEGVTEEAETYLISPWMHTKWLTVFILRHLLDGEVARQVPERLSDKGLLVSALAIGLFVHFDLRPFALLWGAGLLYYITTRIWQMRKTRTLVACRQEVASGNYDGHEVARRLRDLERRGIFVHSLILRLLELEAGE